MSHIRRYHVYTVGPSRGGRGELIGRFDEFSEAREAALDVVHTRGHGAYVYDQKNGAKHS